jgi:periplasmic protein TonB
MDADGKVQATDRASAVRVRAATAPSPQERLFWIGLACAAVLHAALIVGFTRSSLPRQMGEKSGRPDGISVALVDAADLKSKNTFAEDGAPAGSVAPAQPSQPTPKEAARLHDEQKQKPAPRPSDKAAPERASPPDEAAKQDKVSKDQKQEALAWPIDTQALEQVLPPDQAAKQSDAAAPSKQAAKPPPQQPPQLPQPQLQLSLPDAPMVPGGLSPSFARPAGITRSGENDEFGRRVIRALRQTMPRPAGVLGQVTVRFFLTENGNLVEVRLMRSAGDPILDQNVVFAVKQASFPIPPVGSTLLDRTFLVTYIYR